MAKYLIASLLLLTICAQAQNSSSKTGKVNVLAYYSGGAEQAATYPVEKLTHIIYSFCHMKGSQLNVDNAADSATIKALVYLKIRNPSLKVMLSLGGWGGCASCSDVFSDPSSRKEFAASVKQLNDYFKTDGIDLDWEYPGIPGHPGHAWKPEDRPNFTALVQELRKALGEKNEISFAAGGFDKFLQESIEWNKVMPLVDRVNLMSYDLVNGFSKSTGHHTPLYSTASQIESADSAIKYLKRIGVPLNKIVIGAAFYARTWVDVADKNNGLYQPGRFQSFVPYRNATQQISKDNGYAFFFDEVAKASYAYNKTTGTFATFDDERSIADKTKYTRIQGLNGIMFWEMTLDKPTKGLLDVIADNL